jgi:hypothetical protein
VIIDADRRSRVGVEGLVSFAEDYFVGESRVLGVHLFLKNMVAPVTLPDRPFDVSHRLMQG